MLGLNGVGSVTSREEYERRKKDGKRIGRRLGMDSSGEERGGVLGEGGGPGGEVDRQR